MIFNSGFYKKLIAKDDCVLIIGILFIFIAIFSVVIKINNAVTSVKHGVNQPLADLQAIKLTLANMESKLNMVLSNSDEKNIFKAHNAFTKDLKELNFFLERLSKNNYQGNFDGLINVFNKLQHWSSYLSNFFNKNQIKEDELIFIYSYIDFYLKKIMETNSDLIKNIKFKKTITYIYTFFLIILLFFIIYFTSQFFIK